MMLQIKKTYFIYTLIFVLPLLIVLLHLFEHKKEPNQGVFQFFTSVKSDDISKLQLLNGETLLNEWNGPFSSYKQLDFLDNTPVEKANTFQLKIEHKKSKDTVCFLGLNFLINGIVYSLQAEEVQQLECSGNAKISIDKGQLKIICIDDKAAIIQLNNPRSWSNNSIKSLKVLSLGIMFMLFVLAIVFTQPSKSWFLISLGISAGLLFYFYFLGKDASGQIRINGFGPKQSATFFFNSTPEFKNSLSVSFNDTNDIRKTQSYPGQYSFYRIDFPDSTKNLASTSIYYSMGFLRNTWLLSDVTPFDLNGNDLDYVNGDYITSGRDSFVCLTGAKINKTIRVLDFLRLHFFAILCLLSFYVLLFTERFITTKFQAKHLIVFPFLFICVSSITLSFANDQRLIMSEEKRLAFPFPSWSNITALKDYTKQLDGYMKDQLPGRGQLIISNNLIKYKLFSELATNPMVYFGKENWMFYIGENVKDVYENKQAYTEAELKLLTHHLEERRDWLKSKGIAYYILFPRMSHYFYQEYVGEGLHTYGTKAKLEQFLEYLKQHSTVNVIDVYTPMLKAKHTYDRDLYYHSDSHWNLFGAYFAYEEVIKRIQVDFPKVKVPIPLKDINWVEDESNEADLSKLISLSHVITRHEYLPLHPDINSSTPQTAPDYPEYHSVHPLIVYQGKDSAAPKLVMNRDSYSNFLIPYFSTHFSRQTYIWSPLFFPTIIEKEKPDIVITEMMERFLNDLLIDNPPLETDSLDKHLK